ncbi:hypothetical protein RY27_20755 [Litorilinea aerophila]|nr:hypothetical protein RY27_20755 [Litorilinea aerophila]
MLNLETVSIFQEKSMPSPSTRSDAQSSELDLRNFAFGPFFPNALPFEGWSHLGRFDPQLLQMPQIFRPD